MKGEGGPARLSVLISYFSVLISDVFLEIRRNRTQSFSVLFCSVSYSTMSFTFRFLSIGNLLLFRVPGFGRGGSECCVGVLKDCDDSQNMVVWYLLAVI